MEPATWPEREPRRGRGFQRGYRSCATWFRFSGPPSAIVCGESRPWRKGAELTRKQVECFKLFEELPRRFESSLSCVLQPLSDSILRIDKRSQILQPLSRFVSIDCCGFAVLCRRHRLRA